MLKIVVSIIKKVVVKQVNNSYSLRVGMKDSLGKYRMPGTPLVISFTNTTKVFSDECGVLVFAMPLNEDYYDMVNLIQD